jgi:hypothetical protein
MQHASAAVEPTIQQLLSTSFLHTNEILQALTGWVLARLPAMEYLSPDAYATITTSLKELSEAVGSAAQVEAASRTQTAAGGLMLGVQQLVSTIKMAPGSGSGAITAMVAGQEAMAGAATVSTAYASLMTYL